MPRLAAVVAAVALAGPAPAQDRPRPVTPDDYASLAAVTDLAVSPDGNLVAYCEARWDRAADDRKADLWVVPTDGKGKPVRLTADRANDRRPRWAADGTGVYVLANRKRAGEGRPPYDGSAQVWLVPADGREPRPVTRADGGVTGFDYAPGADAIFYVVDATVTDDDPFTRLRARFKAEYGHGTRKVSEVFRLDLDTWRAEKVAAAGRHVRDLAATRDGRRVGMVTATDDTVVAFEGRSRVDVWDADTGRVGRTDDGWRATAASPYPWLESPAWSPDGARLAFCTVFDGHPAEVVVQEARPGGAWAATRVKRPPGVHVRGYGSPLRWLSANAVAYLGEKAGRVDVYGYGVESADPLGTGRREAVVSLFDVTPTGRAVTAEATAGEFPDLHVRGREVRKLTNINPQAAGWQLPTVRHVTWKAPDGADVGGVLELPPGHKDGAGRLPLVVAVHGGPTTSAKAALDFDPHNGRLYFAAKGYAVLCPNYRGSTGYGDKFVADLVGRENDVDVKDILAGVRALVDRGVADPDRVAVMGWSNGGYLTNCLIALKDPPVRVKAASSGAGIVDAVAEWGFNDEPAYTVALKKGLPWQAPDGYRRASPTYGLGNVTTPTLIHVGEADERCPPGHSRMLYRALREYNRVPTELVVYPGEPHGLLKLSHRTAKMEWDLAWFDKYLK